MRALGAFIANPEKESITLNIESTEDQEAIEDPGSWFSNMLLENDLSCTYVHNEFTFTVSRNE